MSDVDTVDTLVSTRGGESSSSFDQVSNCPALTVLYHPNLARVGERALLQGLAEDGVEYLCRLSPKFGQPRLSPKCSLGDPFISRRPIELRAIDDAIEVRPAPGVPLAINGRVADSAVRISQRMLDEGVELELAQRVLLLLHRVACSPERIDHWGLVGESAGALELRRHIQQVADLGVAVLLRGETGVGKERVAQAIHTASLRSERPLVAVNMAALAKGTAASELFGHEKGAFTGANARHIGLFERARGGTLFLDEIGEAPVEIQTMLLRTLSENAMRPIGAQADRAIDVRILAATDANLEQAGQMGEFRAALLYRLSGYEIRVPPLRTRREDIPRLVVHFLGEALVQLDESHRLHGEPARRRLWFPLALMRRLYHHDWPGNVRQLRNEVQQLVIANRGTEVLDVEACGPRTFLAKGSESGERVLMPVAEGTVGSRERSNNRGRRRRFGRDTLLQALQQSDWSVPRAAQLLGVPRATLYSRIERMPDIRKATDFSRAEVLAFLQQHGSDLDAIAGHMRVSKRSLKLRMRALGIGEPSPN